MKQKEIWLMPDYFAKFQCKADQCRHTCCQAWNIPVSRSVYQKLITTECSAELNDRLSRAFIIPETVTEERYRLIAHNYLGECPMLKDGLCMLYKEKTEEDLPKICRLYPRAFRRINSQNLAICSGSCERVVELIQSEDSLHLSEHEADYTSESEIKISEEGIRKILQFQSVFRNTETTLAEQIEKVCLLVNEEEYLKDKEEDTDAISLALTILNRLIFPSSALFPYMKEVNQRYESNRSLFFEDRNLFEKRHPEWMEFFRKLINNSMMYENFPFVDDHFADTAAYRGLCAVYGLLRFLSIAYTADHTENEAWVDLIAAFFHLVDHTSFYYNIARLNVNGAALLKI